MPGSERNVVDILVELGRTAAERREKANISWENIYDRTRIRAEYIRGIESGNYEGFPELVYTKGFVRTYLKLIGAEDLQEDFMSQLNRLQPHKATEAATVNVLDNGVSSPKGFKPVSHFWLFLALVAALVGTGGYVWYAWASGSFNLEGWRWPSFYQPASTEVEPITEISPDVPAPVSEDQEPPAPPTPPAPAPAPKKPSLEIRAEGDVWLRVTIGNDVVFARTLKQGNSASWDLPAQARVVFGRPHVARVILNGKDLGPASPKATKKSETYLYQPDGTYRKVSK